MNRLLFVFICLAFTSPEMLAQSPKGHMADSRDCTACHDDPHQGTLGSDCASCHDEVTFRPATRFHHDTTGFPLEGAHENVGCLQCHTQETKNGRPFTKFAGLKFQLCTDCHGDAHDGEFMAGPRPEDCRDCHTVKGFGLTTYTIAMHDTSNFVLTGSHLAISCRDCHYKDGTWTFTRIGTKCIDCHNNVHGDQLTARFMPDDSCGACHSTTGWDAVSFNHDLTGFELAGKHRTVGCRACHYVNDSSGAEISVFRSLDPRCQTCHKDVHFGQFAVDVAGRSVTDCSYCHTFDNWYPAKFDHDSTGFPLTGGHTNVPCIKCHERVTVDGNSYVRYKLGKPACDSCHS